MKITRDNYQAYILDYFEGTLSVQEKESLLAFLNAHPDCRKEFEEFENMTEDERKNNCKVLLVLGGTGTGKSTFCNEISGSKRFKESRGGHSETKKPFCLFTTYRGRPEETLL